MKKVIYDTPLDPANREKTKENRNHNLSNISRIDDAVYSYFIQSPRCLNGVPPRFQDDDNNPIKFHPKSCRPGCPHQECRLRTHDQNRFTIETKSNDVYNILLSRAELVWNYNNQIPFILRTGRVFGLEMHHRNRNPIDDRKENLSFRTDHRKLEGRLRSIRSQIRKAEKIYTETKNKDAKSLISSLSQLLKREADVEDSPDVQHIIREQIAKLVLGGYIAI